MESASNTTFLWSIGIVWFLVGLITGAFFTYLATSRLGYTRRLREELISVKNRYAEYREQVNQHFRQTSDLVQNMTESYRTVYEHLSKGARDLCGDEISPPLLDLPEKLKLKQHHKKAPPRQQQHLKTGIPDDPFREQESETEELHRDPPTIPDLEAIRAQRRAGNIKH
jgi:uncharacterized membrane-anchored protein YhcB (DUF1043 family)